MKKLRNYLIGGLISLTIAGITWAAIYVNHSMTGHGGRQATAQWTPISTDWGFVEVGTTEERTLSLKNIGKSTLTGNVALAIGCPTVFTIASGGGPYSLLPGASKQVVVRFAPTDTVTTYTCTINTSP
jgi:hypothetical protein